MLIHSAKGSTWKEHKYIKRLNGTYYYPNSYKGGHHIESSGGLNDVEQEEYDAAANSLNADDIESLAREVIRGNFGNGQTRKDLLGENYQLIQDRVNEILLGKSSGVSASSEEKKISEIPKETINNGKKKIDEIASNNKTLAESLMSIGKNMGYAIKNEQAKSRHDKIANK